jgi:hypothetical protein
MRHASKATQYINQLPLGLGYDLLHGARLKTRSQSSQGIVAALDK